MVQSNDAAPPAFAGSDDALEQVAAGVEGFGRGITAHGTDIAAKADGTAGAMDARAAKYHKTSAVAEFAGGALRQIGATALAGPMGSYINAALSTTGHTADQAYDHDPRLTRESVLKEMMGEMLGAWVGNQVPAVMSGINKAGKWLSGKAVERAGSLLEPQSDNFIKGGGKLLDRAQELLDSGVLGKTKAGVVAHAESEMNSVGQNISHIHAAADSLGSMDPSIARSVSRALGQHESELTATVTGGGKRVLRALQRDLANPKATPSTLLRSEQVIRKEIEAANEAGDGYTTHVLSSALDTVKTHADGMLNNLGINAAGYRELQSNYAAAVALKNSVGSVAGGEGIKEIGNVIKKEAVTAGIGAAVGGKTGALLGASLGLPAAVGSAKAIGKAVPALTTQLQYSFGGQVEKGIFAQWLGQQMGAAAKPTANALVNMSSGTLADNALQLITSHAQQPEAVKHHIQLSLDAAPLPQEHKDMGAMDVDNALLAARLVVPMRVLSPDPTAPESTRRLSSSESRKIRNYMKGLVDPHSTLNNPTVEGLSAVRQNYPATYSAFQAQLLQQMGPNAGINHPLRKLAEKHNLGGRTRQAQGIFAQQLYDKANALPEPPTAGRTGSRGPAPHSSRIASAGTAGEGVQSRSQSGE